VVTTSVGLHGGIFTDDGGTITYSPSKQLVRDLNPGWRFWKASRARQCMEDEIVAYWEAMFDKDMEKS
jgi:hypothetical protein